MNEDLLYSLRRDPDVAFASRLRARLAQQTAAAGRGRQWRLRRLLAAAATVALLAGLFSVPAVRASAESFLALFRVVNFVAVPLGMRNTAGRTEQQLDLPRLLSENVQVLQEPGAPINVLSADAAGQAAGFPVKQPSYLPEYFSIGSYEVEGPRAVRVIADVERLRDILNTLGIRDLEVPQELNGRTAEVHTGYVVVLGYNGRSGRRIATLMQTPAPEVSMPVGTNLPLLGEIALRILGVQSAEAHKMALAIDWNSTMLVPVPPNATSFRQVDINGRQGVVIDAQAPNGAGRSIVLWSGGGRVFALEGLVGSGDLLQMAMSVR